jgi:uncharacterized protein YggE
LLNVGVQTNGPSAKQALDANAVLMRRVLDAVASRGVDPADVQTQGVNVYPIIGTPAPDGAQAPVTYQANNSVTVRLRDPDRVAELLDAAFAAGANVSGGISFGFSDESAVRRRALTAALADARAKAEALAPAVGKQLGEVVAVSEEVYAQAPALGGAAREDTPILPGAVVVSASVRVTYELR